LGSGRDAKIGVAQNAAGRLQKMWMVEYVITFPSEDQREPFGNRLISFEYRIGVDLTWTEELVSANSRYLISIKARNLAGRLALIRATTAVAEVESPRSSSKKSAKQDTRSTTQTRLASWTFSCDNS
jgi:hypothetical protein